MNIRLLVEGQRVDLQNDIPIPINLQILDVKQLDKRKSEFTKTIKVPATKNNNRLFGHLFNIQVDPISGSPNIGLNYEPNKKSNAEIISNGFRIIKGYIQIRNISSINDNIFYDVVFYGSFSNLMTAIGSKDMDELDLTDLEHQITHETVEESWNNEKDYLYGLIDYGNRNVRSHRKVNIYNLIPSIRLKRYMDQIIEDAGYTYESDFLNTEEFKNLWVPYNGEEDFLLTEDEIERLTSVATDSDDVGQSFVFDSEGMSEPLIYTFRADQDAIDSGHLDPVGRQYVVPEDGLYNISSRLNVDLTLTYIGNRSDFTTVDLPVEQHFARGNIIIRDDQGNDITSTVTSYSDYSGVIIDQESELSVESYTGEVPMVDLAGKDSDLERMFITRANNPDNPVVKPVIIDIEFNLVELLEGYTVEIELEHESEYADFQSVDFEGFPDGAPPRVAPDPTWDNENDGAMAEITWSNLSNFTVEPVGTVARDDVVTYERMALTDVSQKDFFLSVLKIFNLIAVPSEERNNHLIIQQRDDFFEEGRSIDWTNKLDKSREINLTPVRDSSIEEYRFTFNESNTFFGKRYEELTDRIYGDVKIESNSEFGTTVQEYKNGFEPTVVVNYEDHKVFGLFFEKSRLGDETRLRVLNTDDLRVVTGAKQQITLVVNGVRYVRTIEDVTKKEIIIDSPISGVLRGFQYGAIISNTYDRDTIVSYDIKGKEDEEQETIRTKPRLAYFNGMKDVESYELFNGIESFPKTSYPFLNHFRYERDEVSGELLDDPIFDYNFNQPRRVFFTIENYPSDNLYNTYHKKSIDEILNGSNIYEAYFNLSIVDIINLKYNDNIFIHGRRYFINKVKDFDVTQNKPTKIELFRF